MVEILADNPLLLLFVVAGIGYPLGRVRLGGCSLGVSAVLFAGIAVGALDPRLRLPDSVFLLGLLLSVYTIGLSSGPLFFASFRRQGLRDSFLIVAMVLVGFGLTLLAHHLLALEPALTGGLFTGSLACTPALASVIDYLEHHVSPAMLGNAVAGYSITYPMGVLGTILAILLMQRRWQVSYAAEAQRSQQLGLLAKPLESRVVRVCKSGIILGDLMQTHQWDVVFGRLKRGNDLMVADLSTPLVPGDLLSVIGTGEDLDQVIRALGEPSTASLTHDRRVLDFRRVFVSNPAIAGRRLGDLDLMGRFGAVATRIRRGDMDMLAQPDTVLELGDRVRVVTRRDRLDEVSRFFGDSYRSLSAFDILSFSLGLALGMLVGLIPIPLPGGMELCLGLAGGPLVVALILGYLGRTGPVVWTIPYGANLTLRQISLVLFLAGVGTQAGHSFVVMVAQRSGLILLLAGAGITFAVSLAALWIGYRWLQIPMSVLTGMVAGLQTQTAVLGFAVDQAKNDLPNLGYTSAYPVATVAKIILAQVLVAMLL